MTVSLDSRGKPTADDNVDLPADLNAGYDYTEFIGGVLKVTAAERGALTSSDTQLGWLIVETDTGRVYVRTASAPQGVLVVSDTGDVGLTLNGGWSQEPSTSPSPRARLKNGMVSMNGRIRATTGATTHAFTLPVGMRPAQTTVAAVMRGGTNTIESVVINTNGQVNFTDLSLPATDYRLASIAPFPAA